VGKLLPCSTTVPLWNTSITIQGAKVARSQETLVTFAVKLKLPKHGNSHTAQLYIREAIQSHGGGKDPDDPYFSIQPEDFTVRLVKKETVYG
jgi:hypothetical protein